MALHALGEALPLAAAGDVGERAAGEQGRGAGQDGAKAGEVARRQRLSAWGCSCAEEDEAVELPETRLMATVGCRGAVERRGGAGRGGAGRGDELRVDADERTVEGEHVCEETVERRVDERVQNEQR